jgi:hypothetical protein
MEKQVEKQIQETVVTLLDWLKYDDEMLEQYVTGKMNSINIYRRFQDDLKL